MSLLCRPHTDGTFVTPSACGSSKSDKDEPLSSSSFSFFSACFQSLHTCFSGQVRARTASQAKQSLSVV